MVKRAWGLGSAQAPGPVRAGGWGRTAAVAAVAVAAAWALAPYS